MLINSSNLAGITSGYSMAFNQGFTGIKSIWQTVAMKTISTGSDETYGWMEQIPAMREWVGPRVVNGLRATGYNIKNRTFEHTISVPKERIEDDKYGLYAPLFTEMGRVAAEQPDRLVFDLLASGFTETCYDGQPFFDADHTVRKSESETITVSNVQTGSGAPWYLMDTSRAIRPLIFQERKPFSNFVSLSNPSDTNVFMNKEFVYGTDGRGDAGFGLWQLAFASKATLNATNYAAARKAMSSLIGDNERKLGIRPTLMLVGPDNEEAALKLLNTEFLAGGESNPWKGTVELIVSPWVG